MTLSCPPRIYTPASDTFPGAPGSLIKALFSTSILFPSTELPSGICPIPSLGSAPSSFLSPTYCPTLHFPALLHPHDPALLYGPILALSPTSTRSPVPSLALLHGVLSPCPHLTPYHFHSHSLIATAGSQTTTLPTSFQLGFPQQQPSPVLPLQPLPSGGSTPRSLAACSLWVNLAVQSGHTDRHCQRRHSCLAAPQGMGKLSADSTLASSLRCLVIRRVLGSVKAICLLLPRIFLHTKPSPSCLGLLLCFL